MLQEMLYLDDKQSINRNILECKYSHHYPLTQYLAQVLIETYWNVNIKKLARVFLLAVVLIETYWNVNN